MKKAVLIGSLVLVATSLFAFHSDNVFADDNTIGNTNAGNCECANPGPHGGRGGMGHGFADIAEFLGIDEDTLRSELDESNMATVVANHGKTMDELKAFNLERAREHMTEMGLSDEEIAERIQMMEERFADWDGTEPLGKPEWAGRGEPGEGMGDGMQRGFGQQTDE